ncbi:hypothetical protein HDV06_002236 [Boothiomyces sp. JEL0866]|nr:hypothetical protein HDV06_002236 [Boothiomyces sp. JEL0866]
MTRQPTPIDVPVNKPPLYNTKKNAKSMPVTNKRLPVASDSTMDFLSQLNNMAQDVTPQSNSNSTAKNDFFNMDRKSKSKPKDFLKNISDIPRKDLENHHTNDRVYRKSDISKEKGKKSKRSPKKSPKKGSILDEFDFESSGKTATSDRSSGRISSKIGQYAESSDESEVERKRKRSKKDADQCEYGKVKKEKPKMKLDDLLFEIPTKMSNFSQDLPLDITPVLISSQEAIDKDSVKCPVDPLCAKILKKPFSTKLQSLYEDYQRLKDNPRAKMTARHRFCDYHNAENHIIPQGIKAGYPHEIDFKRIPDRIKEYSDRLEGIINGRIKSKFRESILETFNSEGAWKAQGNGTKFLKIEQAQCGYYGWTGSNYIFKELLRIFKVEKSILTPERAFPQSVNDFIQLVLVPETALLLIATDQKLNIEDSQHLIEAETILKESNEFGNIVHGVLVKDEDMVE